MGSRKPVTKEILDTLPITNKHLFNGSTIFNSIGSEIFGALRYREETNHFHRIGVSTEGITIQWYGDPFEIKNYRIQRDK